MVYGCVFAKTFRIWRVLVAAESLKIYKLTDNWLLFAVSVLLIPSLIINIIWVSIDPLTPTVVTLNGVLFKICYSNYSEAFIWAIICYSGLLIIWGSLILYKYNQKLDETIMKLPNDVHHIAYVIYCTLLVGFVMTISWRVIGDNIIAQFIMICLLVLFMLGPILCLLFVPPVFNAVTGKEFTGSKSRQPSTLKSRQSET